MTNLVGPTAPTLDNKSNATGTLEALDQRLLSNHMSAYWTGDRETFYPPEEPMFGRWDVIRSCLMEAGDVVPLGGDAARRVIGFRNPIGGVHGMTRSVSVGIQLVNPGEIADAHRHTPSAVRFVVEGSPEAFTKVGNDQQAMLRGDLILTPNWHLHSHHNEGTTPVIWLDSLDSNVVRFLTRAFFEEGDAPSEWEDTKLESSILRFPWEEVHAAFQTGKEIATSEEDGEVYTYAPPGHSSVLPTLGCTMQRLRSAKQTKMHRHTSAHVYHAFDGNGSSMIEDSIVEWQTGDIFSIPAWNWHSHMNTGTQDAYLFSMDNKPILTGLGLYREQSDLK